MCVRVHACVHACGGCERKPGFKSSPPLSVPQMRIDTYFIRISEIIKKGKIPSRIKFMLQDVQELRKNKWVQRSRQEQGLKTIDQVPCRVM